MSNLSWKPERRGDVFCSPACGGGCTFAAYEAAWRGATALVGRLAGHDLEWEPRVWENLGWHFEARSKCGRFSVSESLGGGFIAFLNVPGGLPSGKWVGRDVTPQDAVEDARRQAREHLEKYAVCVDARVEYPAEAGDGNA